MRIQQIAFVIAAALTLPCGTAMAQNNPQAATGPTISQQIQNLNWVAGPATIHIANNSTFNIPKGYEMLAPPDSVKFLQLNQNLTSSADDNDYILWSESDSSTWFSVMFYEDSGHIADDASIDADSLLQNMKSGNASDDTARKQAGLPTLDVTGWAITPSYDQQTHRLEWAFNFQSSDGSQTVNFNTRILSRTGDLKIIVVDDPAHLQADIPDFNNAMNGFSFDPGQRYADYKSGDKLAQFGLAGLIAGGAAAVAVKTGLFAGLLGILAAGGKAIIVGIVAAIAAARAFFRRMFRKKTG